MSGRNGFPGRSVFGQHLEHGTACYEGLAPTQKEAGALALAAGVDVGISYESGYMADLLANVREGKVPMNLVDRAVRRILKQKFRLGLFERPYVEPERAVEVVHQPAHQELALQAAREAIVLLKNEQDLLPLKKTVRAIAVIGPNADESRNQLGDYIPATIPQHIVTVLEGIRQAVSSDTKVTYIKGCEVIGPGVEELAKAKEAAASFASWQGLRRKISGCGANSGSRNVESIESTELAETQCAASRPQKGAILLLAAEHVRKLSDLSETKP